MHDPSFRRLKTGRKFGESAQSGHHRLKPSQDQALADPDAVLIGRIILRNRPSKAGSAAETPRLTWRL
jgi:hypothetical protein